MPRSVYKSQIIVGDSTMKIKVTFRRICKATQLAWLVGWLLWLGKWGEYVYQLWDAKQAVYNSRI